MFSNVAWDIRPLHSWQKCHDYFTRTPKPRAWKETERPLRNNRQRHYRLEKDGTTYKCMLYHTAVVTWLGDGAGGTGAEFILDVGYDSSMTRNFFPNFIPSGIPDYLRIKFGKRALLWKGMYYDIGEPFHFNMRDNNWELVSNHKLITRPVLDKEKVKELRPLLTPFAQYVRGLWGIAGGENPYAGDEREGYPDKRETFTALVREDFAKVIKLHMPYAWIGGPLGRATYKQISAEKLIRAVREEVCVHADAYVWKPYNER